jgi:subtilase family serine protease
VAPVEGYTPADLASAYDIPNLPAVGRRPVVAVVVAYDDPTAEADLGIYRATFHLPACTSRDGCFTKLAGNGGHRLPTPDSYWAAETSLDLDMVSAACPSCRIALVEAKKATIKSLAQAAFTASGIGDVVSNSYGEPESSKAVARSYRDLVRLYSPGNVTVVAATGDNGYGAQFPASIPAVTAVGGTSLYRAPGTARGWSESAWILSGGGCSTLFAKPLWQSDRGCPTRTTADISAVADAGTGVAVYNGYQPDGSAGWLVEGGTSVAAAYVAGLYGLVHRRDGNAVARAYLHRGAFYDITDGLPGYCDPEPLYVCTVGPGYDGPTGLGTPHGIAGF